MSIEIEKIEITTKETELQNVLTESLSAEQDVQQLDQVIKLAEISTNK